MKNNPWLFRVIVGAVLVATVGGFVLVNRVLRTFYGDYASAEAALPAEMDGARREGLPLTSQELKKGFEVPDAQNAGPAVRKECAILTELTPRSGEYMKAAPNIRANKATPAVEKSVADQLKKVAGPLARLQTATKLVRCDLGKDYSLGATVEFSEFAHMKTAANLFCGKAWLAARRGNFTESGAALKSAFRIADFAGQEPCMIGMLVQIACSTIAHDHLRQILREHGTRPECLAMAADVLAHVPPQPRFRRALHGEIVFGMATLANLKSMREVESFSADTSDPSGRSNWPFFINPESIVPRMRGAWQARLIQFWRRVFQRLPKGEEAYLATGTIIEEEVRIEDRHKSMDYVMNRILMPVFFEAAKACVRDQARLVCNSAMLELLKYRRGHSAFPARLDQVGRSFLDPFDDKPLRYKKRGAGFIVYSVDADGKDDGGAKPSPNDTSAPRDLVIEYP